MGPQWWQMCRGLFDAFPAFTESILRSDRELSRYTDWSLIDELCRDENRSRMAETEIAQPANFAIQVALAEQLAQFGIRPDAVIGHSAGEVAAHHLAGLLTFEQAIEVIYHRSRLQQRTSGQGRMLAVGLDAETLTQKIGGKALDEFGRLVSVAAINSPSAVTIAGDSDLLDDIARQLDEAGVFNRWLAVKVPYHTHYMDAVKEDLFSAFDGLSSKVAALPLYSTVTGEQLDGLPGRRRLLVAEHARHRSLRTGDPPDARRRIYPLRRAGTPSRTGGVDLGNRWKAAGFGAWRPSTAITMTAAHC